MSAMVRPPAKPRPDPLASIRQAIADGRHSESWRGVACHGCGRWTDRVAYSLGRNLFCPQCDPTKDRK